MSTLIIRREKNKINAEYISSIYKYINEYIGRNRYEADINACEKPDHKIRGCTREIGNWATWGRKRYLVKVECKS